MPVCAPEFCSEEQLALSSWSVALSSLPSALNHIHLRLLSVLITGWSELIFYLALDNMGRIMNYLFLTASLSRRGNSFYSVTTVQVKESCPGDTMISSLCCDTSL